MATKRRTDTEIAEALVATRGIISATAQRLGYSREAVRLRVAQSDELQRIHKEQVSIINDVAKSNVLRAINEQDVQASQWWLSRMARHEGFGREPPGGGDDLKLPTRIEVVIDRPPKTSETPETSETSPPTPETSGDADGQ